MAVSIKSKLNEVNVPVPDILNSDAVNLIHTQSLPNGREALFFRQVEGYPPNEYSIWMLDSNAKTLDYLGQARPISKSAG